MPKSLELRGQRAALVEENRALMDKIKAENRDSMNSSEKEEFDRRFKKVNALETEYLALEQGESDEARQKEVENALEEHTSEPLEVAESRGDQGVKPDNIEERQTDAFFDYVYRGEGGMSKENRSILQVDNPLDSGFYVPIKMVTGIQQEIDNKFALSTLVTDFPVAVGQSLGAIGLAEDIGEWKFKSSETSPAKPKTIKFNGRELSPHEMESGTILITKKMARARGPALEQYIKGRVSYAVGGGINRSMMTGGGDRELLGLFTQHAKGISSDRNFSEGNTTTAITAEGLIRAKGNQDETLDNRWLFHPSVIVELQLITDLNENFKWRQGMEKNEPDRLLGLPIIQDRMVPNLMEASEFVGMLADFSFYWTATEKGGISMQRIIEKYSEEGQIGLLFEGYAKDGMPQLETAFTRMQLAAS